MKFGKRTSVLAFALLAVMSMQLAKASDYEINQFRQAISQIQMYEQQYQAAPSGSYQESQANQARAQTEANAEAIINSPNAFAGFVAAQDQALLAEFERGYQAAPSGSLIERAYNVARGVASRVFSQTLTNEQLYQLQNAVDYNQALQLTQNAEAQYQAAPSGSAVEAVYNNIRSQGWTITTQKFQDFANYQLQDFRQAESLYLNFEQQYQAAASGSRLETFYNQGRQLLLSREVAIFNYQAAYMSPNDLYAIYSEYSQRYQAAASGSAQENLYRQIRDAANSRLSGAPQPAPQPYPQPQPQPQPYPYPQPAPQPQPQPYPYPQPAPQPQPQPQPYPYPQPAPQPQPQPYPYPQPAPQPQPQPYPQPAPQPYPQPQPQPPRPQPIPQPAPQPQPPRPQPIPQPAPQPQPPRPQPIPQPVPQPQPPRPQPAPQPAPPAPRPTCEIHSGANAAGQVLFRVMTSSGAVIGTFSTTQDAAAFATSDPRCFQ